MYDDASNVIRKYRISCLVSLYTDKRGFEIHYRSKHARSEKNDVALIFSNNHYYTQMREFLEPYNSNKDWMSNKIIVKPVMFWFKTSDKPIVVASAMHTTIHLGYKQFRIDKLACRGRSITNQSRKWW